MMTRRTLLLFLLLVLSLSLGCDRQVRYEDVNYYEGRDGLVFEFVENSPAERVYPEELVPVSIRVHNQGSFDLSSVYPAYYNGHESMVPMYATATLIYDDFFFFEDESFLDAGARSREELFLAGKSPYWPEGESRVVTLGMLQARSPGPQRLGADTDVSVSLCYPYETILTTPVCVASDLNEARPGDCLPEDLSFRDQGAPVAVTHVEVKSVPVRLERVLVDYGRGPEEVLQTVVRPVFRMTLRNVGDGQVVRGREFDQRSSCLRSSEQDLESNTAVVYAILGNKALECLPSLPRLEGVAGAKPALVKFYDGEAEVMCRIPEGEDIMTSYNYESMLQVFVDYVYQVRESVTVQIDDSSKAYVPPDISELRCSDFDADYASCRQFSEKHGDYFSNMNCFYCDELKKCLSGGCAQCPGSTDEYVSTRMCVHDCPRGDPVVSVSKTADGRRLKFSCDDPLGTKANEHGRCGCGEFLYYLVYSPEECTEETFQVAKAMTEKGTFNPADEKTRAEVMIPGEWFVELPDGDLQEAYVCVAGRTAADESGDWKLSKPKHEPLHS